MSARSSPGPRATATPILEGRSSLDTLADRLGLVDLQEKPKRKTGNGRVDGGDGGRKSSKPKPKPKPASTLSCCFCFSVPLEEVQKPRPARPQPRPVQHTSASVPVPPRKSTSRPPVSAASSQRPPVSAQSSPGKASYRSRKSTASQTARAKDYIPDSLDPATASAVMAELARPYVDSEEAGYIYMFWLTPASDPAPPVDAARSLLAPPSPAPRSRRASDVVSTFAKSSGGTSSKTMVLKIGRAANVQRRMNQWQRQCGYDIEMLRYYPYLPGASESSGVVPHMTPHAHRVERLIHIELAGMGLRANLGTCDACGRDHREWFEVDATREGIRRVDDVVRRWIDWDEASL